MLGQQNSVACPAGLELLGLEPLKVSVKPEDKPVFATHLPTLVGIDISPAVNTAQHGGADGPIKPSEPSRGPKI